jgi:hypothetical protein
VVSLSRRSIYYECKPVSADGLIASSAPANVNKPADLPVEQPKEKSRVDRRPRRHSVLRITPTILAGADVVIDRGDPSSFRLNASFLSVGMSECGTSRPIDLVLRLFAKDSLD